MVFKGFTDENGNIIPVQGAGTVYNEEKNSLSLGKDTVAIGQDQLVFGRKNVQDANKAEIVGGGAINAQEITGVRHFSEIDSMEAGEIAEVYGWQPNSNGPLYRVPLKIKLKKTSTTLHGGDAISMEVISCVKVENNDTVDLGTVELYVTSDYASGENLFGTNVGWIRPIQMKAENIRTLDWQGNQWNAGDITCDDGEGNTISMRDLLSRIATLEAAAAAAAEE